MATPPQGMSPGSPMEADMGLPPATPTPEMMDVSAPPGNQTASPQELNKFRQETSIARLLDSVNIAEDLDEDKRNTIARNAKEGFEMDMKTRADWDDIYEKSMKLALLFRENKTYPWTNASNVKFPLIATAAMQFSARAYPTLVPSDGRIVKTKVIGKDPQGQKALKAEKISRHMSYQVIEEMEDWEEDMDKLLYILAICGTAFKKTFFDNAKQRNVSKLVLPKNLVVSYWSHSLEDAPRISEILEMSKNDVLERQRDGRFLKKVELPEPTTSTLTSRQTDNVTQKGQPSNNDQLTPYRIIEQHTWLDLDDDGYAEPYVVVFEESSGKLLRVAARYNSSSVKENADGEVIKIDPIHYYTKYSFIPNPDGGFYDLGFGHLLSGINESVDTLINQLVDSGSLNNLQAGFISKSLKIRAGENRFQPGEWKQINMTSDDLRKAILPLPAKDPSPVLLQLLQLLIGSGKELASIAEIFVGKMPGQNTPAYTTKETVEQGMKLFTAIYKRVYRSLTKEFKKLFTLNYTYLDEEVYVNVLDEPISAMDYDANTYDVCPAADPQAASSTEKMGKFQGVMQLMPLGTLNPLAVTKLGLDAMEIPNGETLMAQGPKPPDPKIQLEQMKAQLEQQKAQADIQVKQLQMQIKAAEGQQKLELERQLGELKLMQAQQKAHMDQQVAQMQMQTQVQQSAINIQTSKAEAAAGVQAQGAQHEQKLKQNDEVHKQRMKQNESMQKPKGKTSKQAK